MSLQVWEEGDDPGPLLLAVDRAENVLEVCGSSVAHSHGVVVPHAGMQKAKHSHSRRHAPWQVVR